MSGFPNPLMLTILQGHCCCIQGLSATEDDFYWFKDIETSQSPFVPYPRIDKIDRTPALCLAMPSLYPRFICGIILVPPETPLDVPQFVHLSITFLFLYVGVGVPDS